MASSVRLTQEAWAWEKIEKEMTKMKLSTKKRLEKRLKV